MDKSFQHRITRWTWAVPSAMTLAVLAACGGGSDSGDAPAGATTPAAITAQPTDQSVASAGSASFSVGADGSSARIQWQLSTDGGLTWADVAGATGSTLSLASVTAAQNGHLYRAVVSASDGSTATSAPVTLRVEATVTPPVITAQASSARVVEGGSASFSVTATGANLRYQWQVSSDGSTWADVATATEPTLALGELPLAADGRSYRVVVTNSAGSATSEAATLQVQAATAQPQVLSAPAAVAVVAPAAATFTASVTGTPAPTLQWQRSSDSGSTWADIAGATSASYTTPGTSTADSGTLYRVVATNSADSIASSSARLTVELARTAPSITTQPSAATASVGGQATFTVAGTGTPVPTVQWQVSTDGTTWTNIAGATSTTLTTSVLALADSGKRIRALLTNSQGSTPSNPVVLTVNPPSSVLSGRKWDAGQQLESGDGDVDSYDAGIDDQGRVTVVFRKYDGTRYVLYSTRGTPNAKGTAPSFTTPVAIDASVPNDSKDFAVSVAPNGNAAAVWNTTAACTTATYSTSMSCNFQLLAEYSATTGQWSAPQLIGSSPSTKVGLGLTNSGHIIIARTHWERTAGSYATFNGITWKPAGGAIREQLIKPIGNPRWSVADSGELLAVGEANQSGTTDIVAYRGTVNAGFGDQVVLDQRGAAATLVGSWSNPAGQAVVMWNQNNGTATTRMAATLDSATGAFSSPVDLGFTRETSDSFAPFHAKVLPNGDFVSYRSGTVLRRVAGVWSGLKAFEGWDHWNYFYSVVGLNADASALVVATESVLSGWPAEGSWATYDAPSQALIRSFVKNTTTGDGYLMGVKAEVPGVALLAKNGVGFYLAHSKYDVLPSAAQPAGDFRSIVSLWGFYLK